MPFSVRSSLTEVLATSILAMIVAASIFAAIGAWVLVAGVPGCSPEGDVL